MKIWNVPDCLILILSDKNNFITADVFWKWKSQRSWLIWFVYFLTIIIGVLKFSRLIWFVFALIFYFVTIIISHFWFGIPMKGNPKYKSLLTYQFIISSWLKKILKLEVLKCSRLIWFLYYLTIIISPWLKKILRSETFRIVWFWYFLTKITSLRLISFFWKWKSQRSRLIWFVYFPTIIIEILKLSRLIWFVYLLTIIIEVLKLSRLIWFGYFLTIVIEILKHFWLIWYFLTKKWLHHGWRKFWN